jgi:hypothetical protein
MLASKQATRRRAPRLAAVNRPGRLTGRAPHPVTVVDLSLTGCLARCETLLDGGAVLDLEIALDDGPLTAKVRVADASVDGTAPAGSLQCLAGLEFLGLPAREESRLRRFLDEERRRRRSADPSPR